MTRSDSGERFWPVLFGVLLCSSMLLLSCHDAISIDVNNWIEIVTYGREGDLYRNGDMYGDLSHFLQLPVARFLYLITGQVGVQFSALNILRFINIICTVSAAYYFSALVTALLRLPVSKDRIQWVSYVVLPAFFVSGLSVWHFVNGELFAAPTLFFLMACYQGAKLNANRSDQLKTLSTGRYRKRPCQSYGDLFQLSLPLSLMVLSHAEYILLTPAVLFLALGGRSVSYRVVLREILIVGIVCIVTCLITMSLVLKIMYDVPWRAFGEWYQLVTFFFSNALNSPDKEAAKAVAGPYLPGIIKALKGVFSSYNISVQFVSNYATKKALYYSHKWHEVAYLFLSLLYLFVILGALVSVSFRTRVRTLLNFKMPFNSTLMRYVIFLVLSILPNILIFNARYYPVWMKYHSVSMAGVSFLFISIYIIIYNLLREWLAKYSRPRFWPTIIVVFLLLLQVGLNLFGSIVPLRYRAERLAENTTSLNQLHAYLVQTQIETKIRPVYQAPEYLLNQPKRSQQRDSELKWPIAIIVCNYFNALNSVSSKQIDLGSLIYSKKFKHQDPAETAVELVPLVQSLSSSGLRVFLLGTRCDAYNWYILAKEANVERPSESYIAFDMQFLTKYFQLKPTQINFELDAENFADPTSWRSAELVEVVVR